MVVRRCGKSKGSDSLGFGGGEEEDGYEVDFFK